MLLRTAHGRDAELRFAASWPDTTRVWPHPWSGAISSSGTVVTDAKAVGLPAVAAVIRMPASIIASLPFITYRKGAVRSRAEDTFQWALLHDYPNRDDEVDSYQFFYDVALSLEACQNAFVQKVKYRAKGEVYALNVLDPMAIMAKREPDGSKTYRYYVDGREHELDPATILHIRGSSPQPGALAGVSLIQQHRDAMGAGLAMQQFLGDFYRNSAQSPVVFVGAANAKHAKELRDSYYAEHSGGGNQWKPSFLHGQLDAKTLPMSLDDKMFVDTTKMSVEDACRIWTWPTHLVAFHDERPIANEADWTSMFLKFYMLWRLRRIERAFASDPDLYAGSDLYGEFLTDSLERADFSSRQIAYKNGIQAGVWKPNEFREKENLPPADGGDQIQFPVVGGGPPVGHEPPASGNGKVTEPVPASAVKGG